MQQPRVRTLTKLAGTSASSSRLQPLQFIGNKRSGTSHLAMVLNRIPEVFCTNEADVAWLLYQVDKGSPVLTFDEIQMGAEMTLKPFVRHRLDIGSAGAVHTLRALAFYKGEDALYQGTWRARYEEILHMEFLHISQGLSKRPYGKVVRKDAITKDWDNLAFLGDKMPTQVADPKIFNWWIKRFPETKFIHLVRDPRRVVPSMMHLGFNTWWRGDPAAVLHQWAEIEQWALDIEEKLPGQVFRVYQEEYAVNPEKTMTDLHAFLGIDKAVNFPVRGFVQTKPIKLPTDDLLANEVIKEYKYGEGQRRRVPA